MTHRHDGFECPSTIDYVDTKSCLAYGQNSYSTHWIRSCSYNWETSLGNDIFLLSLGYKPTLISEFFTMRQHHDALISGVAQPYHSQYNLELQCHRQHDSIATSHHDQVTLTASSPIWLGSIIASITQHLHHVAAKSPRQCCHQHDSISTSRHGQYVPAAPLPAWLGSIVVSMTCHLHRVTTKLSRQRRHQ
jgi:hypothetical protein